MSYSRLQERVAELEGLLDNERLYTAEHRGYAQVIGEENKLLREQLDAARQTLARYYQANCACDDCARTRAALGDVAAPPNQTTDEVGALRQRAPETREETEA